jgi:arsenite methyltransferase
VSCARSWRSDSGRTCSTSGGDQCSSRARWRLRGVLSVRLTASIRVRACSRSRAAAGPRRGAAEIRFVAGDACALPFGSETFDAAVATQVYEYVQDATAALGEAFRVLRPGGRLLVLDTDWGSIVWHSGDAERMRRVLAAWEEHLVDPHLPPRLTRLLSAAGFSIVRRATIPLLNARYDPNTISARMVGFITAFVPGRQGQTERDARDWAEDLTTLGDDYFFSLNRYLFLALK